MGIFAASPLDARGAAVSLFPNIAISEVSINHGHSLNRFTLTNPINGIFVGEGVMISSTGASLFTKRNGDVASKFLESRGVKILHVSWSNLIFFFNLGKRSLIYSLSIFSLLVCHLSFSSKGRDPFGCASLHRSSKQILLSI